jgi:hypothetical protein
MFHQPAGRRRCGGRRKGSAPRSHNNPGPPLLREKRPARQVKRTKSRCRTGKTSRIGSSRLCTRRKLLQTFGHPPPHKIESFNEHDLIASRIPGSTVPQVIRSQKALRAALWTSGRSRNESGNWRGLGNRIACRMPCATAGGIPNVSAIWRADLPVISYRVTDTRCFPGRNEPEGNKERETCFADR